MIKLPKLKGKDFERIFQEGKKFYLPELVIYYQLNPQNLTRFAIVVSQKVSKKAVVRNKLKRRLREILRNNWEKFQGFDLVLLPKKGLEEKDFFELKVLLEKFFQKFKNENSPSFSN